MGDTLRIEPTIGNERSINGHVAHLLYEVSLPEQKESSNVGEEENGK